MWKIAWAGDTVVGQVKSFINAEENAEMGYLRGYTEYISTHPRLAQQGHRRMPCWPAACTS